MQDDIKKMADLLRTGYTMLNISCPVCNNPIFKDKSGDLFCAACNRNVIIVKNNNTKENNQTRSEITSKEDKRSTGTKELTMDIKELKPLKNVLLKKIGEITSKLDEENELEQIERFTSLLQELISLLRDVNNF